VVLRRGFSSFAGGLKIFSGLLPRNFKNISSASAQAQSIATLLSNWVKGGLWTCPKVRGTRARVQAAG
jgi:hypothetical protein